MVRRIGLGLAVLTLGIGPWLGLPVRVSASPTAFLSAPRVAPAREQGAAPAPSRPLSAATGCTCREVVVDATNVVRDAEIRTGDAKVVNTSITYIAPSYEDTDVEVDQEAEAISGDAVAGQILAVDGGEGCSHVTVHATNDVRDVELRTGDAIAKNKSVILIDPAIHREDLEIDVDQDAVARSGAAVAGQIIGVRGGGPCGGVILDALNRVREAELRTGDATTINISDILTCDDAGCIDDIQRMLGNVETVEVCAASDCEAVPVKEFVQMLQEQAAEPDDAEIAEEAPEAEPTPVVPTKRPTHASVVRDELKERREAEPETTATPEPTPF